MSKRIVVGIVLALLLIGVFSLAFNIQPAQSEAHTITVPGDYPTIQGAVDAASSGDTVLVYAGVYNESVTVNKTLTVVSQSGPSSTIISSNSSDPPPANLFHVTANNVTISGFAITANGDEGVAAIMVAAAFCNISNNVCYGNSQGIYLWNYVHHNTITNNDVSSNHIGIVIQHSDYNLIMNNTASRCEYGLSLAASSNNQVLNNTVNSNSQSGIYFLDYTTNNLIANNTISSNYRGVFVLGGGSNNIIYHNNFLNNAQQASVSGLNIWDNGRRSGGNYWTDYNGADANNDGLGDTPYVIDANNTDRFPLMVPFGSVPLAPMTIIVPDDYPTIQAAIDAANVGDTVYVRKGGYGGPVYVNKPVALVGENKSSTAIGAPYQGIAVIVSADNVTITGFTMLPSGAARTSTSALVLSNVKGVNISGNNIGGGAEYGVSLVVESSSNCIFSENTIVPSYYGIALQLSSSSFNTFFRNNIYGISLDASFNNWNSTYSLGGNYYGATGVDLKKGPNQDQPGGDGFGDTPYVINANNTDYYPLTRPYTYFTEGRPFAQFNCSSTTPLADEPVTFDASASVDRNGNTVKYFWDFGDGANASSASPVVTYVYGTVLWRTVKLTITDNDGLTDTSTQLLDVRWVPASLSFSTSASSMFAGFKVDLAGTLRDVHGNGLIGKTIALSYTVSGITTWTPITSCTTDNAGNYLATWIPTPTGTFSLKAEWSGDSTHAGLSSTTTLNCLSNDQYVFSVESNSAISNLAFNNANRVLSFTATGSDGTNGYARATVTKNFTANPANITVLFRRQTKSSVHQH